MRHRTNSPLGLYTTGIAALFLAVFLLLVLFGARTYQGAAARQAENNEARAMLSYLSTCVKSGDSAGNIVVEHGAFGPVLTVGEATGYALHIYQYEGQLLEEYSAAGSSLRPDNATVLGQTETFSLESESDHLLRITTDEGAVLLYLKCGRTLR